MNIKNIILLFLSFLILTQYIHAENTDQGKVVMVAPLVVPALPALSTAIITGIVAASATLGLSGDTRRDECPNSKFKPGDRVSTRQDLPGTHGHGRCKKEEGHWHWGTMNFNPKTQKCQVNENRDAACGTIMPYPFTDVLHP